MKKCFNQAIKYIEYNYNNDLSLEKIGEKIGVSISYLSVIFKELSGEKYVDYINKYRISKAKEILCNENITVKEVSERVGYLNVNTFIIAFKKHEGVTPGKYKANL